MALLVAELFGLVLIVASAILLSGHDQVPVPFLIGMAFIVAWSVPGGRRLPARPAPRRAIPPPSTRSPAAAAAWLTVPLLLWGTGFWLFAAQSASPAAVLDAFVTEWPDVATQSIAASVATDPVQVSLQAEQALDTLRDLCGSQGLTRGLPRRSIGAADQHQDADRDPE